MSLTNNSNNVVHIKTTAINNYCHQQTNITYINKHNYNQILNY